MNFQSKRENSKNHVHLGNSKKKSILGIGAWSVVEHFPSNLKALIQGNVIWQAKDKKDMYTITKDDR